jgi:outer membrane protein assembly factor BamB
LKLGRGLFLILWRNRKASFVIVFIFVFLFLIAAGTQFVKVARSDQTAEGFIVPTISIVSPQNNITYQDQVPLTFIETRGRFEPGSPYSDHFVSNNICGYSLDGEGDVYVGENTTLTRLSAGAHRIVLHLWYYIEREPFDISTETIDFSVKVTEPFPTIPVAAISLVVLAVGILIYFRKHKPKTLNAFNTRVWCFLKGTFRFRGTKYILIAAVILLLIIILALYSSTPAADDWTMFHHGVTHNGYSTSTAPNTNHVQWVYPAGGSDCSPAVVDDRVYTGSWMGFYCLNATTGDSIWNYTRMDEWFTSPAVADGNVYTAALSSVYCLNATTGAFMWSYGTGDWIVTSSPAVADGKVYVGSQDKKVYCLDAASGAFLWSYTTGNYIWSSPAVANGRLYVSSFDSNIYCLNASTGALMWNYTTGSGEYYIRSSPAIADGRVYVGSDDGNVYCLDASTGTFIWNYTTGSSVFSSPAVAYGKVYVGNNHHYVYCLNAANGAFIWNYWTSDSILSSPAVADNKVYAGSEDNKLYCLNADTGEFIWSYTTGWDVDSSPAVANGKVYVGSGDNKVYAFG